MNWRRRNRRKGKSGFPVEVPVLRDESDPTVLRIPMPPEIMRVERRGPMDGPTDEPRQASVSDIFAPRAGEDGAPEVPDLLDSPTVDSDGMEP